MTFVPEHGEEAPAGTCGYEFHGETSGGPAVFPRHWCCGETRAMNGTIPGLKELLLQLRQDGQKETIGEGQE